MIDVRVFADKAHRFLENLISRFQKSAEKASEETLTEIKRQMSAPGKPITYPVQWDSEKQRRYVIAKLREEGNLPYTRTDAYRNGWKLAKTPDGFSLSNAHPAGAIGGTLKGDSLASLTSWQSKIHRGRWPNILAVAREQIGKLPKRIMDKLTISAND